MAVAQLVHIIIREILFREDGADVEIVIPESFLQEELGPFYVGKVNLLPEVSGVDPEIVVSKAEGIPVRIADAGSGIHSHTSLSDIGIHR